MGRTSWLLAVLCCVIASFTFVASAQTTAPETTPEGLFEQGTEALRKGEYQKAISVLEALSDRGFVHPDASFNRGVAYVTRVRQNADKPGDLGQAAAAFEETLSLRPGDEQAEAALDLVRAEITRRRSRRAQDEVEVRPTIDRVVVGLASERSWGIAALIASLLFGLGVALRGTDRRRLHVAGNVMAPTAFIALLALAPLTWGAHYLRTNTRPAVVVVTEAHLTDADGTALGKHAVPEGALLEVGERQGSRHHVRWGDTVGWMPLGSVRLLAR